MPSDKAYFKEFGSLEKHLMKQGLKNKKYIETKNGTNVVLRMS